jgi:hypothetical protein
MKEHGAGAEKGFNVEIILEGLKNRSQPTD